MMDIFLRALALFFMMIWSAQAADDSPSVFRFSPEGDALHNTGGKAPALHALVIFQTDEGCQVLLDRTTACPGGPFEEHSHCLSSKEAIFNGPPNAALGNFFSEHKELYKFHVLECVHSEKEGPSLTVPVIVRNSEEGLIPVVILQMILDLWNHGPKKNLRLCPLASLEKTSEETPFKALLPYIKAFLNGNDLRELLEGRDVDYPLRQHFRLSPHASHPTTIGGAIRRFFSWGD